MQIVDVKMNNIEIGGAPVDLIQHHDVMRQGILAIRIQP